MTEPWELSENQRGAGVLSKSSGTTAIKCFFITCISEARCSVGWGMGAGDVVWSQSGLVFISLAGLWVIRPLLLQFARVSEGARFLISRGHISTTSTLNRVLKWNGSFCFDLWALLTFKWWSGTTARWSHLSLNFYIYEETSVVTKITQSSRAQQVHSRSGVSEHHPPLKD